MSAHVDFQCNCGVRLAGPRDVIMPSILAHLTDPTCPFASKPAEATS